MLRGFMFLLMTTAAMGQSAPQPTLLTMEERQTLRDAIAALAVLPDGAIDPARVHSTQEAVTGGTLSGPRDLTMAGFALSRASADPKACALLKKISPPAVCVR